jgi:hypothetical protein
MVVSPVVKTPLHRRANLSPTHFVGVHMQPWGCIAAKISAAGECVCLDTFKNKELAARTYDATAWRFGWPRHDMNFPEIMS